MKKFLSLLILLNISCTTMNENIPKAKKIPKILNNHGDERIDNYYWLRDDTRSDNEVINYLKEENSYKDSWFKANKPYTNELIQTYLSQLPDEEVSFPKANGDYKYFTKIRNDEQLKSIYRSFDGSDELLYNPNTRLQTQEYYDINGIYPSNNNNLI